MYQIISPGPRHVYPSHNKAIFYGEDLLAFHPTSKRKNHPLLAVRECLFKIFAAPPILEPIRNLTRHVVVIRTNLPWSLFQRPPKTACMAFASTRPSYHRFFTKRPPHLSLSSTFSPNKWKRYNSLPIGSITGIGEV